MADYNRNPTGKGGFSKGDPRINRRGRPKTFDAFRELAQSIAHESAKKKGSVTDDHPEGKPVVIDGHVVTVAEAILRSWAASGNPQLQRAFIEIAFGKVPDRTELTGADGGAVTIQLTWGDNADPKG